MTLRPSQVAMVAVALLALSLAGLPAFLRARAHADGLHGVVVDGRGFGVEGAAVFLFSEEHVQLVEETRSDDEGDFRFHLSAERPRIFVQPPGERGLLSAWGPSCEEAAGALAFVLHPARPLTVTVRGPAGEPIAGAEVRVYEERNEAAVVALAETDLRGRVTLDGPAQAHVAVLAPGSIRLARWRFDLAVPTGGTEIDLVLPPARRLEGSVRGSDGALAGIVLLAWEEGLEGGWNGFAFSDQEGRFTLPCSAAPTLVRALDPNGVYLPQRLRLLAPPDSALALELERGAPLVVRTTRAGLPIGTRVWSWSSAAEAWGWGTRSSAAGRTRVPVAQRYSIHAEPLDPAFQALGAWDVPYEVGTLHLEAAPTP